MVNVEDQPDVVEVPPHAQAHGLARFQWTNEILGFMLHGHAWGVSVCGIYASMSLLFSCHSCFRIHSYPIFSE